MHSGKQRVSDVGNNGQSARLQNKATCSNNKSPAVSNSSTKLAASVPDKSNTQLQQVDPSRITILVLVGAAQLIGVRKKNLSPSVVLVTVLLVWVQS